VVTGLSGETWLLRFESLEAPEACRDPSVDLDGDQLTGCDDPDCWARCAPTCPPGTSCPAGHPHCGDGICDTALEDARMCTADCL
jgi:hypothetical protein